MTKGLVLELPASAMLSGQGIVLIRYCLTSHGSWCGNHATDAF